MRGNVIRAALLLLVIGVATAARADQPPPAVPQSEQDVEARLKTFDPEAVAAARHYYASPKVKAGMMAMVAGLGPALVANAEKARGAALSDSDKAKVYAAVNKALADNYDYMMSINMLAALEVLSKDQLVALDQFYSSPVGQSILDKMPQVGQRLPVMLRSFMPKFMASVQENMKSAGLAPGGQQ
jgi:uncharacterized protein